MAAGTSERRTASNKPRSKVRSQGTGKDRRSGIPGLGPTCSTMYSPRKAIVAWCSIWNWREEQLVRVLCGQKTRPGIYHKTCLSSTWRTQVCTRHRLGDACIRACSLRLHHLHDHPRYLWCLASLPVSCLKVIWRTQTRESKGVNGLDETSVFVEGDGDLAIESVDSGPEETEGSPGPKGEDKRINVGGCGCHGGSLLWQKKDINSGLTTMCRDRSKNGGDWGTPFWVWITLLDKVSVDPHNSWESAAPVVPDSSASEFETR